MRTMDRAPDAVTPEALLAEAPWVRRLAGALVNDPAFADDVAQETLRRGLEHPPTSRDGLRGWLATVARNVVRSRWRADRRRAGREQAVARPEGGIPVDDVVARAEEHRRVVAAVLTLEEPYRSTILHRYFDDLGPSAIAERTGTPVDTVRTRLHRALGQLRGRLDAEHGGDPVATRRALLALIGPASGTQSPGTPDRGPASSTGSRVAAPSSRLVPWFAAVAVVAGGGTLLLRSGGDAPAPGDGVTVVATSPPADGSDGRAPGVAGGSGTRLAASGATSTAGSSVGRTATVRLTGVVLDEKGAPVPGVLVLGRPWGSTQAPGPEVHPLRTQRLQALSPPSPPPPPPFRSTSDASGTFDLDVDGVLPDGYVALLAMPAAPSVGSTRFWALANGDDAELTLRVVRGAPLRGRLVDAAGRGIAATVSLQRRVPGERAPWRWTGDAVADAEGRFALDAAPLGPLSIAVRAPGRLGVNDRVAEHRAGEELVLTIGGAPGAVVVGTVTNAAGVPVADAAVLVFTRVDGGANETLNAAARTGADGTYRVDGLAACVLVSLLVDAEGYAPVSILRNTPLAAGAKDRFDVRLHRGATLEGRVMAEDGSPIEGASVSLRHPDLEPQPPTRVARSDADGRFHLDAVALGTAEWRVRAPGWFDPVAAATQPRPDRLWEKPWRGLRFDTDGERRTLEVRMRRGMTVTGRVVDGAGQPVSAARVEAVIPPGPGADGAGETRSSTSGPDGRFAVDGVTPGVGALLRAATPRARTAADARIPDGAGPHEVELVLVATGRITGRVVDERGEGIARVRVGRDGDSGPYTDEGGRFRLSDVPAGPHEVHVVDGQSRPRGERIAVTVPSEGEVPPVEIRIVDAARLRGIVVTEAGVPVVQTLLSAVPVGSFPDLWTTITDAAGTFEFLGMAPGPYRIQLDAMQEPVTVNAGTLDLRLVRKADPGLRLTGTIVDPDGRPVPAAIVAVGIPNGRGLDWHSHPAGGGRFDFAVPSNDARLTVEVFDATDEAGRRLPLRPWRGEDLDGRAPLSIRLDAGRRLAGRILDAKGQAAEGVDLRVVSQGTGAEPRSFMVSTPTTRTDSEGRFLFEGLLEGAIVLAVETGAGRPAIPDVIVAEGEIKVEIHLPAPAAVSGRVLDDQGRPLVGVVVHADTEHRYPGRWSATTDAEGRFRMENLPASAATIRVWLPTPPGRGTDWPWLADHAVETKPGAKDVVVKLERGVFVEGTLLDEQDRPAAGRVLALWDPPDGAPAMDPGMRTISGSWPADSKTGRFAAGPVRPGVLRLMGEGIPGSKTESDVVPIAAPSRDVRIVLRPEPPAVPR